MVVSDCVALATPSISTRAQAQAQGRARVHGTDAGSYTRVRAGARAHSAMTVVSRSFSIMLIVVAPVSYTHLRAHETSAHL
eukprot:7085134-Alexandrium_andersonii.AAC.1